MLPRGLKIPPKLTQNRPKIAPWSTLGPPGGTKILFCRFGIDFGAQFGPPWDPKIDQKSILCEKNAPRSALSKQCLPGAAHHLIFYTSFWSFLVKNDEKTITLLCFLLVFPTLEKPCILQATLLVDSVFANMLKYWKSGKKTEKKHGKNESFDSISKIVTKRLPQAPKIDPKSPILGAKIAKNRQNCGKK